MWISVYPSVRDLRVGITEQNGNFQSFLLVFKILQTYPVYGTHCATSMNSKLLVNLQSVAKTGCSFRNVPISEFQNHFQKNSNLQISICQESNRKNI